MTFSDLQLIPPIQKVLSEIGYSTPTSIQQKAIPIALRGQDVLGSAQTGTGKTAAFSLPIIQQMVEDRSQKNSKRIKALIVTPTRELAIQIAESISDYSKYTSITNTVIFGGVSQHAQTQKLQKGVDILTATPGRLLDLINQGFVSLEHIEYFVLDEADRMLDMGFIHDIKKIIAKLPKQRQSLFFSATMPKNIVDLANVILKNPQKVAVSPVSSTAETIQQTVYKTNKSLKRNLLLHILKSQHIDQALVFSRTKYGADRIAKNLSKKNIKSAAIHGNKSQNNRQKVLNAFKDGELRVLVATDIAARGIDIDKLRYVINFDIPNEAETYVHRIGRCGRAGEEGISISLCEPEENSYLNAIEKLIQQKIEVVEEHPFPQTDRPMTAAEKKEFEKEKQRKKQEFLANRKKNKPYLKTNPNKKRR